TYTAATITAIPSVPAAPTQDGPKCAGTGIIFLATVPSGATGINWSGNVSGRGTSKTTTTTAGTYQARVRAYLTAGGTTCYSGYSTFTVGTVYYSFTAGSITTASDTTMVGTDPGITITNATPASGGDENITYQWRRSGTSSATLTGSAATYSIGTAASNYTGDGTYIFKRYAHDGTCNTSWEESSGQYTLTVIVLCPPNSIGACTWTYGSQIWSGVHVGITFHTYENNFPPV
ncbi:MAG: hypothetical protein LBD91_00425, partial [Prevotellaceae bacterium]|nr:hypothetical protein [Prevotellaceae bacterium]